MARAITWEQTYASKRGKYEAEMTGIFPRYFANGVWPLGKHPLAHGFLQVFRVWGTTYHLPIVANQSPNPLSDMYILVGPQIGKSGLPMKSADSLH